MIVLLFFTTLVFARRPVAESGPFGIWITPTFLSRSTFVPWLDLVASSQTPWTVKLTHAPDRRRTLFLWDVQRDVGDDLGWFLALQCKRLEAMRDAERRF